MHMGMRGLAKFVPDVCAFILCIASYTLVVWSIGEVKMLVGVPLH